jgi:hypothetical protein
MNDASDSPTRGYESADFALWCWEGEIIDHQEELNRLGTRLAQKRARGKDTECDKDNEKFHEHGLARERLIKLMWCVPAETNRGRAAKARTWWRHLARRNARGVIELDPAAATQMLALIADLCGMSLAELEACKEPSAEKAAA